MGQVATSVDPELVALDPARAWPAALAPPGVAERRKMKSVVAKESGQSEGRLKVDGSIGMTTGSCQRKAAFHVFESSRPYCSRSAGSESDENGVRSKSLRICLSDECEVKSFSFELDNYYDVTVRARSPEGEADAARIISIRRDCDDVESEVICRAGLLPEDGVTASFLAPGRYTLLVQRTTREDLSPIELSLELNLRETECNDGDDNNGDGLIDLFDPGCTTLESLNEGLANPDLVSFL